MAFFRSDGHELMSKPQLQSATTLNVLIVANGDRDAALVAESLHTASIAIDYNIAITEAVYRSLLQQHRYDAIIFSDDRAPRELALPQALALLQQSGQDIPFILISETLEGAGEHLRTRISDCVLRDRIAMLPEVLRHLLLPLPQLPFSSPSAIALDREQLSQCLQQQIGWHHLCHQIGATLNSSREADARFQDAIAQIGKNFAVDRVLLVRIDEANIWVEREWRAREDIPSLLHACVPSSEWQELLAPESEYRLHHSFQTANLAEYCREKAQTKKAIAQSRTHSTLSIPIFVRDRLFGSLTLQTTSTSSPEPPSPARTFTLEEISVLRSIAHVIALAAAALQQEERLQQEVEERTEQLETANQAKSEFLSTMSHELRAPLTSVIGFARVLLERIYGELNDKQAQYISAIADSGEHLLSLINDLLDISKIEANREELYLETLSVEEVCLSSLSLLEERAQQAGLELNFEIHPSVTVCYADRRRLKQILVNLLSNAIKFTEAGSVTLKVEPQDQQLYFSVIDTGIGIQESDLQTLFQPFQQIQTPLHRKHKGSGLGLALSRKLARLHGGDLIATSEAGKGSCFTLSLPLQAEPTP